MPLKKILTCIFVESWERNMSFYIWLIWRHMDISNKNWFFSPIDTKHLIAWLNNKMRTIQKILFTIVFTLSMLTIGLVVIIPFVSTSPADFAGRFTRESVNLDFYNTAQMIDSYCQLAQNTSPITLTIKNKVDCNLNPFAINYPLAWILVGLVMGLFFAIVTRIFILVNSKDQWFSFFAFINGVIYVSLPALCCLWIESGQRKFVYAEINGTIGNQSFSVGTFCNSTGSVILPEPCRMNVNWYPICLIGINFLFCLSELICCLIYA